MPRVLGKPPLHRGLREFPHDHAKTENNISSSYRLVELESLVEYWATGTTQSGRSFEALRSLRHVQTRPPWPVALRVFAITLTTRRQRTWYPCVPDVAQLHRKQ